jgi:hypothetical protein
MRITALAAMSITGFGVLAPSLHAGWQDQGPKAELINQLQTVYPLTAMDGIKVTKPGTVLVIQQDGIQANPMKIGPFRNKYANGQVTAEGRDLLRKFDPTGGHWGLGAGMQPRMLVAGENVYLLRMDVRDDGIVMTVQTCGTCDPAAVDPAHKPYIASIQFSFTRGFWAATDSNHVQTAINPLLAFAYTASAVSAQPVEQPVEQKATAPVKFPDLTPPERPAETETALPPLIEPKPETKAEAQPETKPEIEIGWTPDQVIAALGKPDRTDKRNRGQEIYVYEQFGHMAVTFERGKVVAVVSSR